MKTLNKYHWVGLFLLVFILFLGGFILIKPRILILYSVSKGTPLEQIFNRGVADALATNRTPINLKKHYMGTDRLLSPEQMERESQESLSAVLRFDPHVVVAVGADANRLVSSQFSVFDSKTRVVSVSNDALPEEFGYPDSPSVFSITRKLPLDGIGEFIASTKSNAGKPRIAVLGSDTLANRTRFSRIKSSKLNGSNSLSYRLSDCFDEWQSFVDVANEKTDILLILPTSRLKRSCSDTDGYVERDAFISWVELNSKALPIGTDGNFVKNGGAISFYPSYYKEGKLAMETALQLVDGLYGKGLSRATYSEGYQVAVDKQRLQVRNIPLQKIYIEYSQHGEIAVE